MPLPAVRATLARSFDPSGELLDTASPRLGPLRGAVRIAFDRLRRRLDTLVGSELGSALQEPLVTLRNGRYVVPVRADAKARVKGIVHDASGSGQTLFIEPLVVVELGNAWREAQVAEQEEVDRILDELSALVAAHAGPLGETLDALATVRFLGREGAACGADMDATRAATSERGEIHLLSARHPGLTGTVVPIDVHLGDGFTALIVTGPNTGGKTVTLRTLGLLSLMHQAGLHVRGIGRQQPPHPAGRAGRHRGRAVDRPVALDVLRASSLDHPDRRARPDPARSCSSTSSARARTRPKGRPSPRPSSTTSSGRDRSSRRRRITPS